MTRRSRRESKRSTNQILIGTVLIMLVIGIIGGMIYFYFNKKGPVNPETLCPEDGPVGHFVLLVDKTDPLNFIQKQAFAVVLDDLLKHKVPEGYLLSVFALGEDFEANAQPVAELCNPGDGSGKSALTTTISKIQNTYRNKFYSPLIDRSETLFSNEPAKQSPIFEMIQLVAINGFKKHPINGDKKLIILSDMLHNTPQFSMYKGDLSFETLSSSNYGKKIQTDLEGAEVELYYLMNTPALQTRRHALFWENYFKGAGARVVAVRPLEG